MKEMKLVKSKQQTEVYFCLQMVVHIRVTECTGITGLFCIHSGELSKALHIGPSSFLVAMRGEEAVVLEAWGWPALSAAVAALGRLLWAFKKTCQAGQEKRFKSLRPLMVRG
jgi:hypothetical protein